MLSIDQCKAIIKKDLPDDEIEDVRDALYVFAHKIVEDWLCLEDETNELVYPQSGVAITPIPRHNIT